MSKVWEIFGKEFPAAYRKRLYGLELELESVDGLGKDIDNLAQLEEDHSLRNNGREFISHPISLDKAIKFYNDVMHNDFVSWIVQSERCSERGSIHVHVNVLHLEADQVENILRFYSMLEAGFFNIVAAHRRNNIYCVPLSATSLPRKIVCKDLYEVAHSWHKYTALNAKSLEKLGTLEFRHLQATEDSTLVEYWLRCIDKLFDEGERAQRGDLSFQEVLMMYERVFGYAPTKEIVETLLLAHQEDVVNRCHVPAKTLIKRIQEFKKEAA